MVNEPALKDALLALAEQCKGQYLALSSVLIDVAALRETIRELAGEKFSMAFEQKQASEIAKLAPIESFVTKQLDGLIQRVKDGEVC